jgi:hypothetical protein
MALVTFVGNMREGDLSSQNKRLNRICPILLELIFRFLPSTMRQYQDLKFNPFNIRHCGTVEGTAVPPNFNAPDDGQIGRNM